MPVTCEILSCCAPSPFDYYIEPDPCEDVDDLEITTGELDIATEGEAYEFQLESTGGSGNYLWTITDGELPEGLTLDPDGLIHGTPSETGDFTFDVTVADTGCEIDDATVTLTVGVQPEGCTISAAAEALALTNSDTPLPYMSVAFAPDYRGRVIEGFLPKGFAVSAGAYGTVSEQGDSVIFLKLTVVSYDPGTNTITIASQDWDFPDLVGLRVTNPSFSQSKNIGSVTATTIVYTGTDFTIPLVPGDTIMIGVLAYTSSGTFPPFRANAVAISTGNYYVEVGTEVPVDVEETLKYQVGCVADTSELVLTGHLVVDEYTRIYMTAQAAASSQPGPGPNIMWSDDLFALAATYGIDFQAHGWPVSPGYYIYLTPGRLELNPGSTKWIGEAGWPVNFPISDVRPIRNGFEFQIDSGVAYAFYKDDWATGPGGVYDKVIADPEFTQAFVTITHEP